MMPQDSLPFADAKVGVCHVKVILCTDCEDPLTIFIHIPNSMVTNLMWPSVMINTDPGIEIAEDERVLCMGPLMHSALEFIMEGISVTILGCQCWYLYTKIAIDLLAVFSSSFIRCYELYVGRLM